LDIVLKINIKSFSTYCYSKTLLIAMILTFTFFPLLWILSENHTPWLLLSTLLWILGSILIFHPFMEYVYPHMLTKAGIFLLTSILTIISVWFNVMIITLLLPDNYLYHAILNTTLTNISLFGYFYIIITTTVISNMDLTYGRNSYKEDKLF